MKSTGAERSSFFAVRYVSVAPVFTIALYYNYLQLDPCKWFMLNVCYHHRYRRFSATSYIIIIKAVKYMKTVGVTCYTFVWRTRTRTLFIWFILTNYLEGFRVDIVDFGQLLIRSNTCLLHSFIIVETTLSVISIIYIIS
jgi:hypothetical protein